MNQIHVVRMPIVNRVMTEAERNVQCVPVHSGTLGTLSGSVSRASVQTTVTVPTVKRV